MSDRIYIKDLLLRTIVGINLEERQKRQDVLINLTLYADTRPAGASDDIQDAVNYRTITKRIIRLVEGSAFYLVEKMAAEIAATCLEVPAVERVMVRVEKPGALRFARSVGVEIGRTRQDLPQGRQVFVSLGSNIDPERNLPEAVRRLAQHCRLLAVSPVYETQPVGRLDQPNFLNAALLLETYREPAELKEEVLLAIEGELGRVRTADKNAPRTVDLDISLYGEQILNLEGRHIPDPDILRFPHVARPLADLAPEFRHPETGQTLSEIAEKLAGAGLRRRHDVALGPGE
ncbi:MAG: 2-amino-4-hydroxy-6-hydroxymethyldihydropteridine diphosphokinase [Anaerolineae bacterium]|nr:2-amino-4-hydroxy-6-hydroxymethyldihydropteridine diphosphokinase [Anaerolineae bacterium]